MDKKFTKLKHDVYERLLEYKKKRELYEKSVSRCNLALSLLNPVAAVLIFISFFFDNYEPVMKGAGLFFSVMSVALSYYARNENFGGKLIQRSTTYFALCNLHREMSYALREDERYEEFAKRFQEVMENDNRMSLSNSVSVVDILQKNYMSVIEKESDILSGNQKNVKD